MLIFRKIKLTWILLLIIILLASTLRIYQLDKIPPSLNWDEIAAGYNAYTIANYARDETGAVLPFVFKSFLDDKHPVHIYFAAVFIKLFGLSDFVTRLPAALAGVGCVIAIFFLGRELFNKWIGFLAAFFLAISPYNIHFSRGLWETNFALGFFILGLLFFYYALRRSGEWLILSFICFGISLFSYHSSKVIVPGIWLLLILLYFRRLLKLRMAFYSSIVVILTIVGVFIYEPRLLGLARAQQNQFSPEQIQSTKAYIGTHDERLGLLEIYYTNYLAHFTPEYLFTKGDQTPRNSTKVFGQFIIWDLIGVALGVGFLIWKRSRVSLVLLAWLILAPIPSSLAIGAPQATRGLFMMGVIQLLVAVGFGFALAAIRKLPIRLGLLVLIIVIYGITLSSYLKYYYQGYLSKNAIDWQYGMKPIVEYIRDHPEYRLVYMTKARSQPYIFFLYYLKYPLPKYLSTVEYTKDKSYTYNLVSSFDKYNFGNWDTVESFRDPGVLYILTPSEYDGLRYKAVMEVKKRIRYPDGSDAFFIVSAT